MAHFDEIYEIAADSYGIVTAVQAREAGVTTGEMSHWCADGKLVPPTIYPLLLHASSPYSTCAKYVI